MPLNHLLLLVLLPTCLPLLLLVLQTCSQVLLTLDNLADCSQYINTSATAAAAATAGLSAAAADVLSGAANPGQPG
jgi:hypothetical protein